MTSASVPRRLEIDGRRIDDHADCYVVAEIGHNHQGSLSQAMALFEAAARSGADAVKLQKRDNRSLFTAEYFARPYTGENSFGSTYGEHREALELSRAEYAELQSCARSLGIAFFATAFDAASVDVLADLDMPAYKIASGDLLNLPLIRCVAETGKPVILSTGGATSSDVRRAYETVAEHHDQVAVLQCTIGYPAVWSELDLRVITEYRELFPNAVVGFSGHDNGVSLASVSAFALGARVIEKHFTLDRCSRGTDHRFSLEPTDLMRLVSDLRRARAALGSGSKRRFPSEEAAYVKMAKKIVADRALPAGHTLEFDDLAFRSPGDGLPPSQVDLVVGSRLTRTVDRDTPISLDLIASPMAIGAASTTDA